MLYVLYGCNVNTKHSLKFILPFCFYLPQSFLYSYLGEQNSFRSNIWLLPLGSSPKSHKDFGKSIFIDQFWNHLVDLLILPDLYVTVWLWPKYHHPPGIYFTLLLFLGSNPAVCSCFISVKSCLSSHINKSLWPRIQSNSSDQRLKLTCKIVDINRY